ncbi:MAG: hypothetical protein ABIF71_07185 [Planctomycetota bacterium]
MGFLADAGTPDGNLTGFGDDAGRRMTFLFSPLAGPVLDAGLRKKAAALGFRVDARGRVTAPQAATAMRAWRPGRPLRFGVTDWYDSHGHARPAPRPAHSGPAALAVYPQGGFSFFRSAWAPDADYLAVAHYTDSLPHGHTHWDMLAFILHTGGETLIGEPAGMLYTGGIRAATPRERQEVRGYLYKCP